MQKPTEINPQKRTSQSTLLKKYQGKDTQVDMHKALRRAVASNKSIQDITDLLFYGASVKETAPDGKTAMHWAMEKENIAAVPVLFKANASLYSPDMMGNTPAKIALESMNEEIHSYAHNLKNPVCNNPLIELLFLFGSSMDLISLKKVCVAYSLYYAKIENEFYKKLPSSSKTIMERLPRPLRETTVIRMLKDDNIARLGILFQILEASYQEPYQYAPSNKRKQLLKELINIEVNFDLPDSVVISLVLGISTRDEIANSPILREPNAVYMLDRTMISFPLLDAMRKVNYYSPTHTFLTNVIKLIKLNMIDFDSFNAGKKEDVALASKIVQNVDLLTQKNIQNFLKTAEFTVIEFFSLKIEFTSEKITLLSELLSLLPRETIQSIKNLDELLTQNTIQALKEGLLTIEQINKFETIKDITSDSGLTYLREGILSVPEALCVSKINNNLACLLTSQGKYALKNALISIEDSTKYPLSFLNIPGSITALEEKLMTLEQISKFYDRYGSRYSQPQSLNALLSESGLQALREKLITPEEGTMFYHSGSISGNHENLHVLLNPIGLIALRKKLITPQEAVYIPELEKLLDRNNPYIIQAMELGLVKPSDFCYGTGKYSTWSHNNRLVFSVEHTKNLIKECMENKVSNELDLQKVTSIQSMVRCYSAQNQFTLFRGINQFIQNGHVNIKNLHEVNDILSLVENGKLVEADERMSGLKK